MIETAVDFHKGVELLDDSIEKFAKVSFRKITMTYDKDCDASKCVGDEIHTNIYDVIQEMVKLSKMIDDFTNRVKNMEV